MKTMSSGEMEQVAGGLDTVCGIAFGIAAGGVVVANPLIVAFGLGMMAGACT
jgi:hypothetical protein